MDPPEDQELERLVVETLLDVGVFQSCFFLSLLLSLLDGGYVDPGWCDEVEQVLVATWSAHGSADLFPIAFGYARMSELLDLVEVYDEDLQSPGLQMFGKLEDNLDTLE